jgi:hemerythrin
MYTKWSDQLLTGIDRIDRQHKEIFWRAKNLIDYDPDEGSRKKIEDMLLFLGNYVENHLKEEEQIQISHSYPEYGNHKAEHEIFRTKYRTLVERYLKSGADKGLIAEIAMMTMDWLGNHIYETDKKLAIYIKKSGKKALVAK